MRKLIIISGNNGNTLCKYFTSALVNVEIKKLFTAEEPEEALMVAFRCINDHTEGHYEKAVVLYAGHNLYLLGENSPCDALNLFDLYNKMKEVVGGDKTLQEQDTLRWLLVGAIKEMLLHL